MCSNSGYSLSFADTRGSFLSDDSLGDAPGVPNVAAKPLANTYKTTLIFNSATVTRGGDTTRSKSKGVKFIIKVL